MATLYDLAMQYLNQSLPKTFKYDRTNQPGTNPPPVTIPPQDPNAPVKKILPVQGGGDGFSVYNPDPNRTRTEDNYSPYSYRQAAERNLIGTPGGSLTGTNIPNTSTEVAKLMDMYPDYYEGKQLEGIPGAAANYLKNSFIGKGLEYLGDKLPVNNRAILENELLGQGFQLNDIGQFVSDGGDINKADGSNIMAGYNANKVTRQTFEKRRNMINNNMSDTNINPKTGKTYKEEKLAALAAAEDKFFGGSGKATTVFNDKLKQKDIDDGFINDQIPTYDQEINQSTYSEDEEDDILDYTNPNIYNTKNIYTSVPESTYDEEIFNPGDGTGSVGSVDPAGINSIDSTVYANENNPNSVSTSGLTYNQGGGKGGSYDEAGVNTGLSYNQGGGSSGSYDEAGINTGPTVGNATAKNTYTDAILRGNTGGGNDSSSNSKDGTHCCTAANERGDMTLTEVKKLRAWHRKQSKIWQRGYDVWGKVIADNLVAKSKWQSNRVRDFYNHKIYKKRTIGSIYADIVIYPMSMIIGSILTVMPPILGYQENKRHGKSSS